MNRNALLVGTMAFCLLGVSWRIEATEAMAKAAKATCIACHKTAKGGKPGNAMLSPRGFTYLRGIIQTEGYVPLHSYPELDILAAKIAENRRGGGQTEAAKAPAPTPEPPKPAEPVAPVEPQPAPSETKPVEVKPEESKPAQPQEKPVEKPVTKPEPLKPVQVVEPKPAPVIPTANMAAPKPQEVKKPAPVAAVVAASVPAPPQPAVAVVKEAAPASIRIESDGAVILPRSKPAVIKYDWREDWHYDDYF